VKRQNTIDNIFLLNMITEEPNKIPEGGDT
jgi:hypothetical protein